MNLRKCRWWLSIALLIAGISLLVVAFWRHSTLLAILAVAITAIASFTPVGRRSKRELNEE